MYSYCYFERKSEVRCRENPSLILIQIQIQSFTQLQARIQIHRSRSKVYSPDPLVHSPTPLVYSLIPLVFGTVRRVCITQVCPMICRVHHRFLQHSYREYVSRRSKVRIVISNACERMKKKQTTDPDVILIKEVCKNRRRVLKTIADPISDIETSRRRARVRMDSRGEEDEGGGGGGRGFLSEGRFGF